MNDRIIQGLLERYRNFVFIGESGAGKTELAINLAIAMGRNTEFPVHLFDMDQTKPLFRARDAEQLLIQNGIAVHSGIQFQDMPTLVPGIAESIADSGCFTLLDVGGNVAGARMIGQLSGCLNGQNTYAFYLINVYRPWSQSAQAIEETMRSVTHASRISNIHLISNPNLGPATTADDILEGCEMLSKLLDSRIKVDYLCASDEFCPDALARIKQPVIRIHRYISYPYECA